MPFKTHEIEIGDVEYLRHGSKPLLARLFRPLGTGPFPALVDVHGGAWNLSDRLADSIINEALARSGVVVAALDFRMPPEAPYPASMADINYGIRWLKVHATEFGSRPELVGIAGSSSGGHQAMLAAMRPHDARYAAIPLPAGTTPVDATVRCAIMYWPVIDPLGRYHYAQKLKAGGKPYPEIADLVLPLHDKYWKTEEAMAEGSPLRILERGEKVELPPAQYIQGTNDVAHPRDHLDRFVASYRKAGGHLELELFEGMAEGFIIRKPDLPASSQAIERIIAFVHEHVR
jgi:acetyl esterase